MAPFRQALHQIVGDQSESISPDETASSGRTDKSVPPPILVVNSAHALNPESGTRLDSSGSLDPDHDGSFATLPSHAQTGEEPFARSNHIQELLVPDEIDNAQACAGQEVPMLDYLTWDFTELGVWSGNDSYTLFTG